MKGQLSDLLDLYERSFPQNLLGIDSRLVDDTPTLVWREYLGADTEAVLSCSSVALVPLLDLYGRLSGSLRLELKCTVARGRI